MRYFVRDSQGVDYSVGCWTPDGYVYLDRTAAVRELHLLDEPGAYVWGTTRGAA